MRVSILQDQLLRAITTVIKVVDSRPTLPVLANILLQTEDARLKVTATNLAMSVVTYIGAKVDQPGAITLPAKTLNELVAILSPERVDLTLDIATQTIKVHCGTTNTNIKGIAASEFPPLPDIDDNWSIKMPGKDFKLAVAQTGFATAHDDSRPILTGICLKAFDYDGPHITFAAADGYRLAMKHVPCEHNLAPKKEYVIPADALAHVARLIAEDQEVTITLNDRLATLQFASTQVTVQLLDGKFPDVDSIIPKTYATQASVWTEDFLHGVQRVAIFARDSNGKVRVLFTPSQQLSQPGELSMFGVSAERGDAQTVQDAGGDGDPLEAAYSYVYLAAAADAVNTEQMLLESNGAKHPLVIRPYNDLKYITVIMPMDL